MKHFIFILTLLSALASSGQTADFTANPTTICVGGSVQFTDGSTGATSWSWTFLDGGSGQSSSLQNPIITYTIPGTYTVILTVSNGTTSDSEIKTNFITVVNAASINLTSPVGSDSPTVCVNSALTTPITYSVVAASGVTFTGLPAGVSGNFIPNAGGGIVQITGSPTLAGVYPYSITTIGAFCTPVTVNGTITVVAAPTLTLSSSPGSQAQTVCVNNNLNTLTYTFGGSATTATVSGLPAGVTSITGGNVLAILGAPTAAGTYNYSVTTVSSGCTEVTLSGSIIVEAAPTIVLNTPGLNTQTVCVNTPISPINYTIGGSATSASSSGLPIGFTVMVVGTTVTVSGTSSISGIYPFTISTLGGTCTPATVSGTLTIETPPTILLNSAAGTDNQTICESSPIIPITYQIGGSATSAIASGLPSGITAVFGGSTLTISGFPFMPGTYNYTVTTIGSSCVPQVLTGTIIAEENPYFTLTSAVGTDAQTACVNSPILPITYALGGSATGATVTGLPSGISVGVSAGVLTLSGSSTQTGVFNYTATSTGGTCPSNLITGVLTIDVLPTLLLSSAASTANQSICDLNSIAAIDYTFGGSATGTTITGLPIGITSSSTAFSTTILGSASTPGSYNYTISTTGGSCPSTSLNGVITVEQIPTLTLTSSLGTDDQTLCENSMITPITIGVSGSATGVNFIGLPSGLNGVYSAGIASISGSVSTAGTYSFSVVTTGGSCTPVSYPLSLTVEASPTLVLSTMVGSDNQTICSNTALATISYTYGGSATGVNFSGLPAGTIGTYSGGTATISGIPTVAGTFNYNVTTFGGTCSPVNLAGTISVQSSSIALSSANYTNDQLVCLNTSIDTIVYAVGGPITSNDLPVGITGSYLPGTPNTYSISGTALSTGTYYYTLLSNNLCGSLVVVGNITVAPSIPSNSAGSSITVCEGSTFEFIGNDLNTSSNFIYEYQWLQSNSITGPWIPANGLNNTFNYSGIAQMSTSYKFYKRIVSAGNCVDSSAVVQLSIDALPFITNTSVPSTICTNDTLLVNGFTASNGVFTNWFHNGNGTLLNTNSASPTYIPVASDNGNTITLNYVVSSSNSCAPSTITGTYTFTILPDPTAFAGGSATVCANGAEVIVSGAQATNGTINWTSNGNGTLINTSTLAPHYTTTLADTNSTVTLLITVTSTGCTQPISDSAMYTISVNPFGISPSINAFAGEDQVISLGQSANLEAEGVAITNWSWSPSTGLSDTTSNAPIANPLVTTDYILTVIDINGCMDQDTIRVTVLIDYNVFIPNLFTPNGDNSNDFFEIVGIQNYPNSGLTIINREGELIFSSDSYDNTWDGTYEGKPLPEATYYYRLSFDHSDMLYKGAVTILRSKK